MAMPILLKITRVFFCEQANRLKKKKEKEKAVKDHRKLAKKKNKIVRFYVDLYLFIFSVLSD
jgi:hypothetical protein